MVELAVEERILRETRMRIEQRRRFQNHRRLRSSRGQRTSGEASRDASRIEHKLNV
jgi:ribosomal protein S13